MIQTPLFIDKHDELQQVRDLKKRFKDAAEEAHDIVDLFVYNINRGNQISLNLDEVMRSIKSFKEEFMTMVNDNIKMNSSSPRNHHQKTQSATAGTPSIRNFSGTNKIFEEVVVGFDGHAALIRDKLVEDQKRLDFVSIVGMGGVGKTTLAIKVFNDPFVMYHFHVRGWVTVSQTYEKQDLLIQILGSVGMKLETAGNSYSRLREMLHKRLTGKRYLIVLDDIWSTEAWDDMKLFFPNNHTGSRILLTSRHKEVALHAKSHGFVHQLECLTEEESWELLCMKVFHGDNCPKWLIKPGMQIVKSCHGLPLTLVVVAGVLGKEALSKDSWERIGRSVSTYIVNDQTTYIQTLALSFDHLPGHMRDCFLYLGGFPEDCKFRVQSLLWLWVAEGFIQEDGTRSMEEIAEDYLMELVDRNLVVVASRKSNGGIKSFYIHDLLRELCLEIARKESFCQKTQHPDATLSVESYKHRRIFIKHNIHITNTVMIRSLVCLYSYTDTRHLISMWSQLWMLLMVLDLRNWVLDYFPEEISLLVHLRYLAISYNGDFPSFICNLWNLQTIIISGGFGRIELPNTISKLVNLRHLRCGRDILFPAIQKPMNLQTISDVVLGHGAESLVKCFPSIKKLTCLIQPDMEYDFESQTSLENLKLRKSLNVKGLYSKNKLKFQNNHIGFPASLKSLTLARCNLPWSDMSIIQSLPKLEVLKLLSNAFVGHQWDAGDEQCQHLKFLKLSDLRIEQWEASIINFPCLKNLLLEYCYDLEEIPSEIGYIPTLELINIVDCSDTVVESLNMIQKEQHVHGNFELKINVNNRRKQSIYGNFVR